MARHYRHTLTNYRICISSFVCGHFKPASILCVCLVVQVKIVLTTLVPYCKNPIMHLHRLLLFCELSHMQIGSYFRSCCLNSVSEWHSHQLRPDPPWCQMLYVADHCRMLCSGLPSIHNSISPHPALNIGSDLSSSTNQNDFPHTQVIKSAFTKTKEVEFSMRQFCTGIVPMLTLAKTIWKWVLFTVQTSQFKIGVRIGSK